MMLQLPHTFVTDSERNADFLGGPLHDRSAVRPERELLLVQAQAVLHGQELSFADREAGEKQPELRGGLGRFYATLDAVLRDGIGETPGK